MVRGHSFGQLLANLKKHWARFTPYLFYFAYWFSFPCVFFYGKYLLESRVDPILVNSK